MLSLLCMTFLFGTALSLCPPQYQLNEGKCVKPLLLEQSMVPDQETPIFRSQCWADGARLPIIHSYYDNAMFERIANSFPEISGKNIYVALDLVCNHGTRRLEYGDGTPLDYIPTSGLSNNFDCVEVDHSFIMRVKTHDWDWINAYKTKTMTVICWKDPTEPTTTTTTTTRQPTTKLTTTVKPTCPPCPQCATMPTTIKPTTAPTSQPLSEQCGDYEPILNTTSNDKPCLKLFTEPMSWDVAQKKCVAEFGSLVTINNADENKYLWRTAVTSNILNGIHIGAHQSSADPSVWTWIDGEVPIEGKAYDNFVGSFPIPGAGECASMLTESSTAEWINEDCSNNKQAFFCRRNDFSKVPKNCPKDEPKAGDDIIPPGFPTSDIPCEYVLFVSANKLVEIEIFALVTDVNSDFLEIFEGPSGSNLLASLTGSILSPNKMRTSKSNVVRVNWLPNGTGTNRGFRIRYYEVDP